MGVIAVVFPGQGAQYSGMGRELYETSAAARAVFEQADALRPGTARQCFSGSAEELALTVNAQPCLFCVDLAAGLALREAGLQAGMTAGFSLGELPALVFAGALSFTDGFRLVCRRSELMQAEAEAGPPTSMLAALRLSSAEVEELCRNRAGVYPANYNCPGQTVVSGREKDLADFGAAVRAAGGRVMPLAVSAGFHTPLLAGAAAAFRSELDRVRWQTPQIPVYANFTAEPYGPDGWDCLSSQIDHPVRWEESVRHMLAAGADVFVEAGPGKTLSGFLRKINPAGRALNVQDSESLAQTRKELLPC
jgi:[acyl-carrier-protein] S-malonyltransferase